MSDRRRHRRVKKRIQVEFGVDGLDQTGVVTDISIGGIYIQCRRPPPLGTLLHIHVLDRTRDFYVEGEVVRLRLVDPKLRRVEHEGMGIRFRNPAELVLQTVPDREDRTVETMTLNLEDEAHARKVLKEQLAGRVILVPIVEPYPALSTVVEFCVRLEFAGDADLEGAGRLVQVLPREGGADAVIEVQNIATFVAALEQLLA